MLWWEGTHQYVLSSSPSSLYNYPYGRRQGKDHFPWVQKLSKMLVWCIFRHLHLNRVFLTLSLYTSLLIIVYGGLLQVSIHLKVLVTHLHTQCNKVYKFPFVTLQELESFVLQLRCSYQYHFAKFSYRFGKGKNFQCNLKPLGYNFYNTIIYVQVFLGLLFKVNDFFNHSPCGSHPIPKSVYQGYHVLKVGTNYKRPYHFLSFRPFLCLMSKFPSRKEMGILVWT
jgi:hypothetical protein